MKKIIVFIFCAVSFCVSALSPVFTNGVKISFIGDSITQHGTQQNGFIHLFMDGLKRSGIKNASFVNEGIGGARSSTLLERIDRMLAKKPRIVVLQCGVNDVGWGKKGCTLEQYKENMGRILDKCKEAGAEVIWVTPT
ncbi:MAG: SGNH/GDSL hydrolase family protein, partial [Lentisphaeria bacterium]|nr:SGNH/GDSL hydrolase family protein [Lentisphaeria bacterium]